MPVASRDPLKAKTKSASARVQRASGGVARPEKAVKLALPDKAFEARARSSPPKLATVPIRRRSKAYSALPWDDVSPEISGLKAHDLVTQGVPVATAKSVMGSFSILGETEIYGVLGISPKTMQRRASRADKTLDPNASDRALRLIAVIRQATSVLGSFEAAERWLSEPAIGLDRRRPIDLLQSSEGTDMVKTLLGRMDYGVYS